MNQDNSSNQQKKKTQDISNSHSYANSGVNIDTGNRFVKNISSLIASTKNQGTVEGIGGFGGLFDLTKYDYKNPYLVSGTDGVGTKLLLAQKFNQHKTIGIDLVAMCVNDIITHGAQPLFFLDYFACGKLDLNIAENVIAGIVEGCKLSNMSLIGGETAEMPGMYENNHYDLAGFAVGIVEKDEILPNQSYNIGDIVIGFESSGIHSNGLSLARSIINDMQNEYDTIFENHTIAEELLTPTRIYTDIALKLRQYVSAFSHITGGGLYENLERILSPHQDIILNGENWTASSIFSLLRKEGNVQDEEMLRVFNNGIGFVAILPEDNLSKIPENLTFKIIGHVKQGEGKVYIENISKIWD